MDIDVYDKILLAEEQLWFYLGRRAIIQQLLDRYTNAPHSRYLDVGCGTGGTIQMLKESAYFTAGMDISWKALTHNRGKGTVCLFQGDASHLAMTDGAFDLVTSLDVLEHCEDDVDVLSEIHRVLAPGGICCLTVPALMILWSNLDYVNRHLRRYTRGELREKAETAGFRILKISYMNTWLFPVMLPIRLAQRVIQRPGHNSSWFDFAMPNQTVNSFLTCLFKSESHWLKVADLPVGSSLIAILQKV